MNYQVIINDGLINLNTLSPNGLFYYKIKAAKELNKSAFGCPISFYDKTDKLIYYQKNTFAHELHSIKEQEYYRERMESNQYALPFNEPIIKLVSWSREGNVCYFLEYSEKGTKRNYENIFLNFKGNCIYRINDLIDNGQFANNNNVIDNEFEEDVILKKLELINIDCTNVLPDKIKTSLFQDVLKGKWYPEI